jgi:hypothetical protein
MVEVSAEASRQHPCNYRAYLHICNILELPQ